MTIATTLKTTMRGALLGSGVFMSAVIFATAPATAHETNSISNMKDCNIIKTLSGGSRLICQSTNSIEDKKIIVSAVTIYNRRHCHANGVCHKHRYSNPNHRH